MAGMVAHSRHRGHVALAATLALLVATPAAARERPSLTERNRAIVTAFVRQFYGERDVKGAFERYVAPDYIQHNPGVADGRDAAVAMLSPFWARPGQRFDVKRIIVDGDMAAVHVHGRSGPDDRGGAVVDLFRLKDGRIVEHWDVIQPVPATAANPHPMF